MANKRERIECCFKLMEYDNLSEEQHNIIISLEEQYLKNNKLSEKQIELLESIFRRAAER